MPEYARYRAISGQGLPCIAMLTLCQKQAGAASGACERPGRNPVPGRPCWAPLAPRHAWEALACPHARPSSPAGYTPALISHVGTPWAQSHLPWPFETLGCWGVLSQVARVGHAVPPLTSMLTPGRRLLPGPHAPFAASAGELSPNPASLGLGAGEGHSGEAGEQGPGVHLVSCSISGLGAVSYLRTSVSPSGSPRLAAPDLEPVPGSPSLPFGALRSTGAASSLHGLQGGCLAGEGLGVGPRGLRRWDTDGIGVFVPEAPEGLRQPQSSGSETPVGICIPLSTHLVRNSRAPSPGPSQPWTGWPSSRPSHCSLLLCLTAHVKVFVSGL